MSSHPRWRRVTRFWAALVALIGLLAGGASLLGSPVPSAAASPSPWTIVPTPNPGAIEYFLYDVSCTSWTHCIAVGAAENSSHVLGTLIEEWNGTQWSLMTSPDSGSGDNYLNGVSCSDATDCVAVGFDYATPGSLTQTLVETWDGTSWSIATSPDVGSGDNLLTGVSCSDPTECTAVGSSYSSAGAWRTLVESWNGTTWTAATSPDVGSGDNMLAGVSCPDATDCVAVGSSTRSTGVSQTLIESWDGTTWTTATSPGPGSGADNTLSAVSCASSASCLAVGTGSPTASTLSDQQTLVESWNGTTWTAATSPDPGDVTNFLTGVSCTGVDQCQAVGAFSDSGSLNYASNTAQTLVVTWDGTNVSVVPSPQQGTASNFPEGLSCVAASSCVMAGWNDVAGNTGNDNEVALVEMASGGTTAATVDPSVTPSSAIVRHRVTYAASVTPASGPGTPTGGVTFTIGSTDLCSATLVNGSGSCTSTGAPVSADTVVATYIGDPTYTWSSATANLIVTYANPESDLRESSAGGATATVTLSSCTPTSATTVPSASGSGSVLTSGGAITWKTSGGTTIARWSSSSPGRGTCATSLTEHELSGVVTGGTSTYTRKERPGLDRPLPGAGRAQ